MSEAALASVYAVLPPLPLSGIWLIHKHVPTGELLGPSVPFNFPTRVVEAIQTPNGWVEVRRRATKGKTDE